MLITIAALVSLSAGDPNNALHDLDFGSIASAVGDVDADGIEDFAVGGAQTRVVHVVSGRDGADLMSLAAPTGAHWVANRITNLGDIDADGNAALLLSFATVVAGAEASMWSGREGHRLYAVPGASAVAIGDRNGDGVDDFVLASTSTENGSTSRIDLAWRSGKDGSRLRTADVELVKHAKEPSLSSLGDVDGDGIPDVGLVAGPEAFVLSGKDGSLLQRFGPRNGRNPWALTGGVDFDGDHRGDILIGYPNVDDEDAGKGVVVACSGARGKELWSIEAEGGWFGFAICVLGDIDADGLADFVVGSHGESFVDPLRAYSSKTHKLLWLIDADFDSDCHRIPVLSASTDHDHDGARDLLVGCPAMGGRCMRAGYAMLVSGKTGEKVRRTDPKVVPVVSPGDSPR